MHITSIGPKEQLLRPRSRRFHVVDIENLAGCARPTESQVKGLREAYWAQAEVGQGDLVVVACNHGAAMEVGRVFTDVRKLWRSGKDGADLALLELLENENIANRFSEVVVGSGDGIFAEILTKLATRGVRGYVVSRREALARRLRMAVGGAVTYLVPSHQPLEAVSCRPLEVA